MIDEIQIKINKNHRERIEKLESFLLPIGIVEIKEDKPTKECTLPEGLNSCQYTKEKPKDSEIIQGDDSLYVNPLVTLKEWNEKIEEIERLKSEKRGLSNRIGQALENIGDLDGYAEDTYLCSAKDMKEILEGKST